MQPPTQRRADPLAHLDDEPTDDFPNIEQSDLTVKWLEVADTSLRNAALASSLALFAILGTLTRIAIYKLATYHGNSVYPEVVVQAVGCTVMGIVVKNKVMLESYDVSLFAGFGTGFCGSVTTFSSWMLDIFTAFNNSDHDDHNGFKNVVNALTQIVLTLSIATSGLRFGVHISTFLLRIRALPRQPVDPETEDEKLRAANYRRIYHIVMITFGFTAWLTVIFLAAFKHRWRKICLALTIAPIGCYIRYLLSISLNPVTPRFPLGTFSANMIATAFNAMLQVVQENKATQRSLVGCDLAQAFVDGYTGCLSTVSTFAVEIRGMRRYHAYRYALVSIVAGQAFFVLILGTYLWVHGSDGHCD